jgi:hypothetical protein
MAWKTTAGSRFSVGVNQQGHYTLRWLTRTTQKEPINMKRILLYLVLVVVIILIVLNYTGDLKHIHLTLPHSLNFQQVSTLAASLNQAQASSSSSSYVVAGAPSISANFINTILSDYGSPAAGTGQALYDLGVKYSIDPVYALAFFKAESTFGKYGMATVTYSLGNMRCMAAYACYRGFAAFSSWQAGYEAWYKLIRDLYVNTWQKVTIAQIVPTYAPDNPSTYISAVEQAVDTWRAGKVSV